MPAPTAADFAALMDLMAQEIPGFRIAYKDDAPRTMPLHHRLIHGAARRIVPGYDADFTTVLGPVIYLPARARADFARAPTRWYATLRHERAHLLDGRAHPLWMPLSYVLLPLPAGLTWRAYWELRGYLQTIICRHAEGQPLDAAFSRHLVGLFAGRAYLFMLPAPLARRLIAYTIARVERGEAHGLNPPVHWWRDFLRPMLCAPDAPAPR
jgi:hypothetical protein